MPLQLEAARGQLLCFQTYVIAFSLSFLLFTTCAHNRKPTVGFNALMQASRYSFKYDRLSDWQVSLELARSCWFVQIISSFWLVLVFCFFFLSAPCFLLLICLCGHKSKMSPWVLFDVASWQLIEELWDWHLSVRWMDNFLPVGRFSWLLISYQVSGDGVNYVYCEVWFVLKVDKEKCPEAGNKIRFTAAVSRTNCGQRSRSNI